MPTHRSWMPTDAAMPQARTPPQFRAWGAPPTWTRRRRQPEAGKSTWAPENPALKKKIAPGPQNRKFSSFSPTHQKNTPTPDQTPGIFSDAREFFTRYQRELTPHSAILVLDIYVHDLPPKNWSR